jgi:hypothetical protein
LKLFLLVVKNVRLFLITPSFLINCFPLFFISLAQDERVLWRGTRALRELILKDEAAKTICYDSNIDQWLLRSIDMYPDSATVQGHCIRLLGALAFGNDRFRRKSGEKGVMACLTNALSRHGDDETVMLHVSTALTNLTHNSFENRSRYFFFALLCIASFVLLNTPLMVLFTPGTHVPVRVLTLLSLVC